MKEQLVIRMKKNQIFLYTIFQIELIAIKKLI